MTLTELHNEVCAMTDVYEPALDMSFVYAVRRALGAIYREHTVERVVKVLINGSRPLTRVKEFRHLGDRVETLSLSGKCYSMRTYGEGEIVIHDGEDSIRRTFCGQGVLLSGILKVGGSVDFCGKLSYTVCDILTYAEMYDSDEAKIPSCTLPRFNCSEELDDFLAISAHPTDSDGKIIENAIIRGDSILFESGFFGEVNISYYRLPTSPSLDSPDEKIDIPHEYERLLTAKVAAILLYKEDEAAAELSLDEYRTESEKISASKGKVRTAERVVTNGWA